MLLFQVPMPSTPPPSPEAVLAAGGLPDSVFIAATMIVIAIVVGVVLYPLMKAFARRLEGKVTSGTDPMVLERVGELEHRLAEAEERIDFNERMLAQREPLALPREKAD